MSNPAQPSLTWQIYSYDSSRSRAFRGEEGVQSLHIQMNQNDFHVGSSTTAPRLALD